MLAKEVARREHERQESAARPKTYPDHIKDGIDAGKDWIRHCYEVELNHKDPTLEGRILAQWVIGFDGRVTKARIVSNTTGSNTLGDCVVSRIMTWTFTKPEADTVEVNYPFTFRPGPVETLSGY